MSYFVVDIETDGQLIGKNSIICFGAVKLMPELDIRFYAKTRPISGHYNPETLSISGFSREEHESFDEPATVMKEFALWIKKHNKGRAVLMSDNNGYDAAWINYYFLSHGLENPFGWTSRRIGDLYCGMMKDVYAKWKHLRDTESTHNPLDDALGNAEALLKMKDMGLNIKLK